MESVLQGACRNGSSCLHSAMILQESINATGLGANKKVFVAYFDAAKAFDSVWTDGLFFQLHNAGLVGKTWQLLYKSYEKIYMQSMTCWALLRLVSDEVWHTSGFLIPFEVC